jgi:hypothetical protein
MKYRDEYLENGGVFCTYCHSDEIGGDDMRQSCFRWWDNYTQEDIIEIDID